MLTKPRFRQIVETPHYSEISEDDTTASIAASAKAGVPKPTDQSSKDNIKVYMGWNSLPSIDNDPSGTRNPFQNKCTMNVDW